MSFPRLPLLWVACALLSCALQGRAAQAPEGATAASGQGYASGDAWIDRQLVDIDAYARRYPASFVDELTRQLDVRRGYAEAVLQAPGWRPGDLYLACAFAQARDVSCRELVRAYSLGRSQGWAHVLAVDGTPDNLQYRAVRHAIVASYDHWDRPIELDARLREQLGDHDQRLARARAAQTPAANAPAPAR